MPEARQEKRKALFIGDKYWRAGNGSPLFDFHRQSEVSRADNA